VNVIESVISSVRQGGIRLSFVFCASLRDWSWISRARWRHDTCLPAGAACDWL